MSALLAQQDAPNLDEADVSALAIVRSYQRRGLSGRPLRQAIERHVRVISASDPDVAEALLDASPRLARTGR